MYGKYSAGWRRPIGCLKSLVIFRKRATNYRALLRKMTHTDKISYDSTPLCRKLTFERLYQSDPTRRARLAAGGALCWKVSCVLPVCCQCVASVLPVCCQCVASVLPVCCGCWRNAVSQGQQCEAVCCHCVAGCCSCWWSVVLEGLCV